MIYGCLANGAKAQCCRRYEQHSRLQKTLVVKSHFINEILQHSGSIHYGWWRDTTTRECVSQGREEEGDREEEGERLSNTV